MKAWTQPLFACILQSETLGTCGERKDKLEDEENKEKGPVTKSEDQKRDTVLFIIFDILFPFFPVSRHFVFVRNMGRGGQQKQISI